MIETINEMIDKKLVKCFLLSPVLSFQKHYTTDPSDPYSFRRFRRRMISFEAVCKSPCNWSSFSFSFLISLWHAWRDKEKQCVKCGSLSGITVSTVIYFILTTFWRNKSSLSHFNLLISSFSPSLFLTVASSSRHREQDRLFGVPAEDMDSSPVSESSLEPLNGLGKLVLRNWWWRWDAAEPSNSSLFREESSLSEMRILFKEKV